MPAANPLARRRLLAGAAGLAATVALGGCGTPVLDGLAGRGPDRRSLTFWNLFSGPAASHMDAMQAKYLAAHPQVDLSAVHLAWGNPYYTKLALATLGHRPPDVAISHLSRVATLARAGLLEPYDEDVLARRGITADRFTTAAWKRSHVDGRLYAIPLDTHPFVLYYRTDVARRAGLLGDDGRLRPISGTGDFVRMLTAAQRVTGAYGGVITVNSDPATSWRWFASLYGQLGGEVIADGGRHVVLDDATASEALEFMRELTVGRGLLPSTGAAAATSTLFSTGKAGFLLDGVWALNTYLTAKTPVDMTPLPAFFGSASTCWADSHSFVLPRDPDRDATRRDMDLTFIDSLLHQCFTWGLGGLVPAWRPVQDSARYRRLVPQAHTIPAAYSARYDPPAWYAGAGSDFENLMGDAASGVQTGQLSVAQAVRRMRHGLDTYAHTTSPLPTR